MSKILNLVNKEESNIKYIVSKFPDGTKKSLKGFQFVYKDENGEYQVESEVSEEKAFSEENELKTIYKDGQFFNQTTLTEIRERINSIV